MTNEPNPFAAIADAAKVTAEALGKTADVAAPAMDAVLDLANRQSRDRFGWQPETCSYAEYSAPFPLLAGDVDC